MQHRGLPDMAKEATSKLMVHTLVLRMNVLTTPNTFVPAIKLTDDQHCPMYTPPRWLSITPAVDRKTSLKRAYSLK